MFRAAGIFRLLFIGWLMLMAGWRPAAAAPLEGEKKLLFIRAQFTDSADSPSDDAVNRVLTQVNQFFKITSRGKFSLAFTVPAPVKLAKSSDEYHKAKWPDDMRAQARAATKAAGTDPDQFDYEIIYTKEPGDPNAEGVLGGKGIVLSNDVSLGLIVRELARNYGVPDPAFRSSNDDLVLGDWTPKPYGVNFDAAGGGATNDFEELLTHPFGARAKWGLGWLTDAEVTTVDQAGMFALYPHDLTDQSATTVKALQIPVGNGEKWWVESRRAITDKAPLMNGAFIYRTHDKPDLATELLDMSPDSPDGSWDSPLLVGQTFSDDKSGVYITVTGKQTVPWSFADTNSNPDPAAPVSVVVNRGPFPDNHAPRVSVVSERDRVMVGKPASLKVFSSDEDGDQLTYFWDFGDGSVAGGLPKIDKVWTYPGDYRVRCTVSDMKGGQASRSTIVTVVSPTIVSKRYRISGKVTLDGKPVVNARVYYSPTDWAETDSDGTYILNGLPAATYGIEVRKHGAVFYPAGFSNPVGVGPNAEGINFVGESRPELARTAASFSEIADLKHPSDFALVSPKTGEQYLLVRGKDGALWARPGKGDAWENWRSLGGYLTSSPSAVVSGDGRFDIFARSGPWRMVHRTSDKGTWSDWETLDAAGSQENKVDVSSWGGGRLDVFAQGYENAFWHRSFDSKWSDWEQLDGKIAGDPAAVSRKKDSVDILANSLAGTAVGTSWNGTEWGDWEEEQLPADAEKGFAINSWNEGRMDVLVRTKKGEIWHQSSEGKWTPWKRVGGQLSSLPGLYAPKVGTLVAVGAQGDQLVMNKYEGIWSGWEALK